MAATVSPHQVADLSDDDVLSQAFPAPDGIVCVSYPKIQKACEESKFAQAWSRLLGTKGGDKVKAANHIRDVLRQKIRQNSQCVPLAVTNVSARQTAQLVEPPQPSASAASNLTCLPTNYRLIIRAIFSGRMAEIFGDDDILTCGSLDAILPIGAGIEDPFVVPALTELGILGTCDLCMIEIAEGVVKAIDVACCGISIELDGLTGYF